MPAPNPILGVGSGNGYMSVTISDDNGAAGHYIELYRSAGSENNGIRIQIAQIETESLAERAFQDYAVASGVNYLYTAIGVDGSGNRVNSNSISNAITLSSGWLHAVDKAGILAAQVYTNALVSGGVAVAVNVLDLIPHNRGYGLAATPYMTAGASIPAEGVSAIEMVGIDLVIRIPSPHDANRAIIRNMVASRRYACYRDTRGNKFFGRIIYDEQYGGTFTDLSLRFQILDFNEAVA